MRTTTITPKLKAVNRFLVGALIGLLFLLPLAIRSAYTLHLLIMMFWLAASSVAWNIIGGYTGQLSIGHAVFLGFGAYASAVVQAKLGWIPFFGLLAGIAVSAAFAFVIFYPCFSLRGPYFTMATLAIALALRNVFLSWDFIGKAEGILIPYIDEASVLWFQFKSKIPFYYLALVLLISFVYVTKVISEGRLGYAMRCVRENEATAVSLGINNPMIKSKAIVLSAAMMSVMGTFYFQYVRYIDPEIFIVPKSIEIMLPSIIGGMGTLAGPILGTLIIYPVTEYFRSSIGGLLSGSHYVVIAIVLIVVVEFRPQGINNFVRDFYWRLLARIVEPKEEDER